MQAIISYKYNCSSWIRAFSTSTDEFDLFLLDKNELTGLVLKLYNQI